MKYIRMYPIVRNKACVLRYLYGSLNLYSAQMEEEEYIINKPNRDNSITLININLSIFFIVSTLLNYMINNIKKYILAMIEKSKKLVYNLNISRGIKYE